MVVDDEKDLTMLLEYIFMSTAKYDVVVANSGAEAQEKAVAEKPDLIFLDFVMPGIRGDEVLRFFRAQPETKNVPVVIMSGLGGDVYFKKDKREMLRLNLQAGVKNLNRPGSAEASSENLMKKYRIAAILPKPFTSQGLKDLVGEIFKEKKEKPGE